MRRPIEVDLDELIIAIYRAMQEVYHDHQRTVDGLLDELEHVRGRVKMLEEGE